MSERHGGRSSTFWGKKCVKFREIQCSLAMVGRDGGKRGLDRFSFLSLDCMCTCDLTSVHRFVFAAIPFVSTLLSTRFTTVSTLLYRTDAFTCIFFSSAGTVTTSLKVSCFKSTSTVSTTRHCDVLHVQHQMCSLQSSYSQSSTSQQSVTSLSSHRLALLSATTSTSLSRPGRDALKGAHPPVDMARSRHSLLELFMRIRLVG